MQDDGWEFVEPSEEHEQEVAGLLQVSEEPWFHVEEHGTSEVSAGGESSFGAFLSVIYRGSGTSSNSTTDTASGTAAAINAAVGRGSAAAAAAGGASISASSQAASLAASLAAHLWYQCGTDWSQLPEPAQGQGENSSCAICQRDMKPGQALRSLPDCGHTYHKDCLASWLHRNPVCPSCRTKVKQPTSGKWALYDFTPSSDSEDSSDLTTAYKCLMKGRATANKRHLRQAAAGEEEEKGAGTEEATGTSNRGFLFPSSNKKKAMNRLQRRNRNPSSSSTSFCGNIDSNEVEIRNGNIFEGSAVNNLNCNEVEICSRRNRNPSSSSSSFFCGNLNFNEVEISNGNTFEDSAVDNLNQDADITSSNFNDLNPSSSSISSSLLGLSSSLLDFNLNQITANLNPSSSITSSLLGHANTTISQADEVFDDVVKREEENEKQTFADSDEEDDLYS
jgi:hypothetical protein